MTDPRTLVRVELSFVTTQAPEPIGDRIQESVSQIVGREALEEFRVRTIPLDTKQKGHLRSVE
jgi:hypothetical protein